jgi:hypothetical protein
MNTSKESQGQTNKDGRIGPDGASSSACGADKAPASVASLSESGTLDMVLSVGPKPTSKALWAAYVAVNYDTIPFQESGRVWDLIGGNIGAKYGPPEANTCAARVSRALNYGGAGIPDSAQVPHEASKNFPTVVYKGVPGDGRNYIVSAAKMQGYFTALLGAPSRRLRTVADISSIVSGLAAEQCAVFATGGATGNGHTGLLRRGYTDPFVESQLPVDAWILPL